MLNFRRQKEERKEFELAQARRIMEQEEDRLEFFKERQAQYQQDLLDRQKRGMTLAEMALYDSYMKYIKERIEWQIEAVETAMRDVETKKEELLAARKDRKTLERLRSRRYDAFLADLKRRETRHLDEVALGKYQDKTQGRRG